MISERKDMTSSSKGEIFCENLSIKSRWKKISSIDNKVRIINTKLNSNMFKKSIGIII